MSTDNTAPKGGRARKRRSIVIYIDTMEKFKYISQREDVPMTELLEGVMRQTIKAWEEQHGVINVEKEPQQTKPSININEALQEATAHPYLKRGNPHREKKNKAEE